MFKSTVTLSFFFFFSILLLSACNLSDDQIAYRAQQALTSEVGSIGDVTFLDPELSSVRPNPQVDNGHIIEGVMYIDSELLDEEKHRYFVEVKATTNHIEITHYSLQRKE